MKIGAIKQHGASVAILKAMSLFSGVKVITVLASLVRNKLIAVFIGPAGLGLVILFNSVIDLVGTGTRLSIDQSAMREISSATTKEIPSLTSVVRRWARWLAAAAFILMAGLSPLLSFLTFDTIDRWPLFCLLAVVPGAVTLANMEITINQGLRRFREVASGTVAGSVLGLVVAVPLILWLRIDSIKWIILTYGLTTWLGAVIFRARVAPVRLPRREIVTRGREFVKLGAFITMSIFITQAMAYVFVLYLNDAASTAVLGRYQGGYTLVNTYVGVVLAGIWMEYYPRLAALSHSPRRTSTVVNHEIILVLKILTPVLIIFMLCARWIVWLVYAADFEAAVPYVILAAVGVALRAVSWCLGYIILAAGDGRTYLVTESLSAVTGLLLNVAGYHFGGFAGLGLSYIAWYAVYTFITAVVARRRGIALGRDTFLAIFIALVLTSSAAFIALTFLD